MLQIIFNGNITKQGLMTLNVCLVLRFDDVECMFSFCNNSHCWNASRVVNVCLRVLIQVGLPLE